MSTATQSHRPQERPPLTQAPPKAPAAMRYEPLPAVGGFGSYASGSGATTSNSLPINFRASPFFKPESVVMTRMDLAVSPQGDRRCPYATFMLNADQKSKLMAAKISPSNPQYQVRLYCCSDSYYAPPNYHNPHAPGYQPRGAAPMEFPGACEIKVNGSQLASSKLRGIKKKEGSTCPPDLTAMLDFNKANRIDVIYVNTDRRYYLMAYLVEATSVDTLSEKARKGKSRTKQDVIDQLRRAAQDDEIAATSSELSLKDPVRSLIRSMRYMAVLSITQLTFARITTPARGVHCQHLQSFELSVFLLSNEQTPTWECPVCSQSIRFEDLVIDGYMQDVLANTAESTESVVVDDNGLWKEVIDKSQVAPVSKDGQVKPSDDDLSDDDLLVTTQTKVPAARASTATAPINLDGTSPAGTPFTRGNTQPPVFIDLTASDDDDAPSNRTSAPLNASASPFALPGHNHGLKRAGEELYDPRSAQRGRFEFEF